MAAKVTIICTTIKHLMQNLLQRNVSFVPKYYQYDKNSPQDGGLEGNGFVGELVASDEADV